MVKVTITNRTVGPVLIKDGLAGVFRRLAYLKPGGRLNLRVDPNATYCENAIVVHRSIALMTNSLPICSDDLIDFSDIIVKEGPDGAFRWDGIKRDVEAVNRSAKGVSLKFDEALRSGNDLEKLSGRAKICHHQCKHLLLTYKEGMRKMAQLYSHVIEDDVQIVKHYRDGSFKKIGKSLDSLEYIVCDAKDLLGTCETDVGKVALTVVSMMRPPVEKDMEVYSDFVLLIREFEWHLDVMEYLMEPSGVASFVWSPTMCRYVLARKKAPDHTKPSSFALMDRRDLQGGSINIPNTIHDTILKRCKAQDLQSRAMDLEAFKIHHLNLHYSCTKPRPSLLAVGSSLLCWKTPKFGSGTPNGAGERRDGNGNVGMGLGNARMGLGNARMGKLGERKFKKLGGGGFKKVFEGKWYGQSVAIATIELGYILDDFDDPDSSPTVPTPSEKSRKEVSEIFRKEVNELLQLQHPKVVSLFGWAETTDAPAPIKKPDDKHRVHGGYIVTEKMKGNLDKLMKERKDPFSNAVQIDILLQIVEAMLYVHKHNVMHRDLKPGNILVNPRSLPARRGADTFYNVKLIDFGSSKVYVGEDGNTYNRGTAGYGAPEMMKGREREADHGTYGPSVDVFSFAMTCHQVITGRYLEDYEIAYLLKEKRRPKFPYALTVLPDLKELTEKCWSEKPEDRPSFKEIQERLWTIKMKLALD